jgi:hypothetical protein
MQFKVFKSEEFPTKTTSIKSQTEITEIMKTKLIAIMALTLVAALNGRADVLELKNGKSLTGKYVGGTAATIKFETSAGVQAVETSQVVALTFTGGSGGSAPAASASASAPTPAAGALTIPAGTVLTVRMIDPVSSKDKQGKKFAAALESDVAVNGTVVLPAGTKVHGKVVSAQQARRYTGQSSINLQLTDVTVGSTAVPIVTGGYTDAGARSGGKVARGAAAGAAIGAIADEDAGKGAAIGAAASGIRKGEAVAVNPGTLLDFNLQQPVTIKK